MKNLITLVVILLAVNLGYSAGYITIRHRCMENNLNPEPAHLRNMWASKCFSGSAGEIREHDNQTPREYALVSNEDETRWDAPQDPNAGCEIFTNMQAFCLSSCYTPDQRVLFKDGYFTMREAFNNRQDDVVTVSRMSSLDNIYLSPLKVDSYTISFRDGHENIIVIKYGTDKVEGRLQVTDGHPVFLANGTMVKALDLKTGDTLMDAAGKEVKVLSLEQVKYFGKVYNVAPSSFNPVENILSAQGILVGSANYQYNQMFQDLYYKKLLRKLINVD